jgi:tRNA-modifying protein YgfZ
MSDRVLAEGVDARSFLQGQLSQDMAVVDRDGSAWSWLLQPTGKVAALVLISSLGPESYVVNVDSGFGDGVMARLNRFKLRVKVGLSLEESSGDVYPGSEAERIEAVWPAMGSELTVDETIPNAAGINDRTVSFTKGCYTGQELVARVDSRGDHTPQRLRRLDLVEGTLEVGEELLDDDGKTVGRITSVHADQALGWVARAIEVGAEVRSSSATVLVAR